MDRVNKIIQNPSYNEYVNQIVVFEKERIFCKHDMVHFFDVARIAYILNLEEGLELSKSVIYAAGLLHDIGRYKEYKDGTPHDKAGVEIATTLLLEAGYSEAEISLICYGISKHRKNEIEEKATEKEKLASILYRGDKLSRLCRYCPAKEQCYWDETKKNMEFYY